MYHKQAPPLFGLTEKKKEVLGGSPSHGEKGRMGVVPRAANVKKSKLRPFRWMLGFVVFVGLILSFCGRNLKPHIEQSGSRRRLAGEDEKDPFFGAPQSPELSLELEELCAVAEWVATSQAPETGRSSPNMVEEVLKAIEEEGERKSPGIVEAVIKEIEEIGDEAEGRLPLKTDFMVRTQDQPSKGKVDFISTRKRPMAPATDDDEKPGPSSKVPRQTSVKQNPTTSQQTGGASTAPPLYQLLVTGRTSPVPSKPSTLKTTPASETPQPRPNLGPAAPGGVHPYVRLPAIQPGVQVRPWNEPLMNAKTLVAKDGHNLLREIRKLLLTPVLDKSGLDALMARAEELVTYAFHKLKGQVPKGAANAVQILSVKFLLFNAVFSVITVVGKGVPAWWHHFAESIPTSFTHVARPRVTDSMRRNNAIGYSLSAALELYKKGISPEADEIIRLKRHIFGMPHSFAVFRRTEWDPFREDDN